MAREKAQEKQTNTKATERHKERIIIRLYNIIFVQNHHDIIVI